MPKKKPIDKRLKNLFEDIKPEQSPAEVKPAPSPRASEEKPAPSPEVKPITKARKSVETVSQVSYPNSVMSLAFQAGHDSWATLQVLDETDQRKWSQDEHLLVKQVADQLSLALENARLFQETQSRAEDLAVLNEMGRELSAKLDVYAIAEVVYRFTSRLMDTKNFFIAFMMKRNTKKAFLWHLRVENKFKCLQRKWAILVFLITLSGTKNWSLLPLMFWGFRNLLGLHFLQCQTTIHPRKAGWVCP